MPQWNRPPSRDELENMSRADLLAALDAFTAEIKRRLLVQEDKDIQRKWAQDDREQDRPRERLGSHRGKIGW